MRLAVLAFALGVAYVQSLPQLLSPAWGLLAIPILLATIRRRYWLPWAFLPLGVAWSSAYSEAILQDRLAPQLEGRDIAVTGWIADLPQRSEHGWRFRFDVETMPTDVRVPRHLLLSTYEPALALHAGDHWQWTVRLKRPHGWQNPGGFDYEAYLLREHIGATGYVRADRQPQQLVATVRDYPIERMRDDIGRRVQTALAGHVFAGTVAAFVNGDQHAVTPLQWQVLQQTGTAHLLAISGMNIGWVAGIAFMFARRAWSLSARLVLLLAAPRFAAIVAIAAALFYAALAGFSVPTQRALIMVTVVMGALLWQRRVSTTHVLAAALFAVLLYDPLSVLSIGFWLSFISVAVILVLAAVRGERSLWREWSRMQWGITLALTPLLILWFHNVPLVSPLANLLAIPAIELAVIPLSLVGASLLYLLPTDIAVLPLLLADRLLEWLWLPLQWLASRQELQWSIAAPPMWTLFAAGIGIVWLLLPRGWPAKWVGALWCLPAILTPVGVPPPGAVWFTLLDVGQGLAAVVRTANHTLVFDTGPFFTDTFNGGSGAVIPYLRASGVKVIDVLMVSHDHQDHIGGAATLIASYRPTKILSSSPAALAGSAPCQAGISWQWDGVRFVVLNPERSSDLHDNNLSCVLKIDSPYGGILLPGDIEQGAEAQLVHRYGTALQAQLLVAPHHGSKTSSSPAFVAAVAPRWVLYPIGYRNRYRHPHPTISARYQALGVASDSSAASGALRLTLDADGARLRSYRRERPHYWFARTAQEGTNDLPTSVE